jgi:hypothetical protein
MANITKNECDWAISKIPLITDVQIAIMPFLIALLFQSWCWLKLLRLANVMVNSLKR